MSREKYERRQLINKSSLFSNFNTHCQFFIFQQDPKRWLLLIHFLALHSDNPFAFIWTKTYEKERWVVIFNLPFSIITFFSYFLFLISYFLFLIVYCLLFIVYCLLFIVYCLLFIVYCLLFIVYCLLLIAYCLLFIVYCLLPIAYCLLFIVYCLLFIAFWPLTSSLLMKLTSN